MVYPVPGRGSVAPPVGPHGPYYRDGVHPGDRVRFVTETARAVIDGKLVAAEGARAVQLQAEQVTPLLRSDRDSVTRSECQTVATNLRLLAEQVTDRAAGLPGDRAEAYLEIARAIGAMAQSLR